MLKDFANEPLDLFRNNPNRMSLVQHGNNHDGYEFYKYTTTTTDPYPARPLADQEADIVEGRTRMRTFTQQTGIPYAPVMVFPYNISPTGTLALLKYYNYQATINSSEVPLDTVRTRTWDSYMEPAELDYANFGVFQRYGAGKSPYPFLLFLGRPVWEYDHADYFAGGAIGAYNSQADAINSIYGGNVEWLSIDEIMKRLYHEKLNDDDSMDVRFWGNHVIVSNETDTGRIYHLKREETLNVPVIDVKVDGAGIGYTVTNRVMQVDVNIQAHGSRVLQITYGGN